MKHVLGFLILLSSLSAFAQDNSNLAPNNAPQSAVEGQIAAAEVFQVKLPEIKYHTEDGTKRASITLEMGIGEVQEQWLESRLSQLRQEGAHIEFVVTGSDVKTRSFEEAKRIASVLKTESEKIFIGSTNIQVPKGLNYQKERVTWTIVRSVIAGGTISVGAYFGADMPPQLIALMASQATLMSGAWTYNSPIYNHWITRSGFLPKADARLLEGFLDGTWRGLVDGLQSSAKQWSASTLYLYLLKQGAALTPIYTGVTNPTAILTDAAFIGIQGLFSRFFVTQTINHHYESTIKNNPELKLKMQIWRMRTNVVMALSFGIVEQLANFHVPYANFVLIGLGISGGILYKYVTSVRVNDMMKAIFTSRYKLSSIGSAGKCSILFSVN